MTNEEKDHWDNRIVALMAALLLRGQIETFNGIEIGGRRRSKIEVAVTWAEDILACVERRDSRDRATDKVINAADEGEPFGGDCPPTVEEPEQTA